MPVTPLGRSLVVSPMLTPLVSSRVVFAAAAGASPAQAATRVSSPLRKRWQRTPPVARPLPGYSANGVSFTAPGSVPGRAVDEPEAVSTTAPSSDAASPDRAPNHTTRSP